MLLLWIVTPCRLIHTQATNVSEKYTLSIFRAEETLISTFKSTRRHNSEQQHRHFNRRENLKCHKLLVLVSYISMVT
jgi:hypothetical protein